ncbi:MAG TPA: hypothetical protein IAB68_05345 [Candidatus Aphodocola excrementigallinarum]|uniref:Uncharacterized protein n=1 Tax=Candidatus Aphodocola excrementigallinarum TaxID=2840670 RepID=A0A9D1LJ78_9FIRM|nr:hypothetical protein [Candidatus Aphodocola excrementigallinarum]
MKKGKKSLKELKKEYQEALDNEDYDLILELSSQIKKSFPKNPLGYMATIQSKTNNYKKYLNESEMKDLKEDVNKLIESSKKDEKKHVEDDFNEYVNDCKEVENLIKIKKELTKEEFLNDLYHDGISFINQNISIFNNYNIKGKRIINIYDFINGLFYVFCMIFNLIYRNYLLILTIPFGIFGVITIYSFLNMNFIKKDNLFFKRSSNKKILDSAKEKINSLKKEIDKTSDVITFLKEQKLTTISRIPSCFVSQIGDLIEDDEALVSSNILNELKNDNMSSFTYLINEKTDLKADEVISKLTPYIKEDDELSSFIDKKLLEIKNGQKKSILMKDVKKINYIITIILMAISVLSFIVLIKNFYEVNLTSFIIAVITGVISMFIYNINTGKHNTLSDTFGDNLLTTIFNASLIYDLVYFSIIGEIRFTYAIIEMPIIFILILIGFVMLASILKYNYLLKKLRETKKM